MRTQEPLLRPGDRIEQFKQERRNLPDLHRNLYHTSVKHPMMVYYALVCRVKFHSVAVAVWKINARNINVRRSIPNDFWPSSKSV